MAETSPERITVWRCLKCGDVGPHPEQTCWVRHVFQGRGGYEDHGGRKPIQALLLPSSEAEEQLAVEKAARAIYAWLQGAGPSWTAHTKPSDETVEEAEGMATDALRAIGFLKDEG